MKFKDCIIGKVTSGEITKEQAEQIFKQVDERAKKYFLAGRSEEAAELAAEDFLQGRRQLIDEAQRNLRQAALKQQEVNADYAEKLKESGEDEASFAPKYAADMYQRAAWRGQSVQKMAYKFMDKAAETLKANFLETGRDYDTFAKGVRHLLGEAVDEPAARQAADVMKQTFDYLHARYKSAGGIIGKIENYFPQVHKKESIRKVSKDEWVDYTLARLDREKMIDESTGAGFTAEKLKSILYKEYDSIVTAGRSDLLELSRKGEAPMGRGSDIDQKRTKSRFMQFKDANAFLEYNAKFGVGDKGLISAFLGSVDSISKDIGVLEVMGPRPSGLARFLNFKIDAAGSPTWKKKWTDAQFRILTSRFEGGDTDSAVWRLFSGTQNWIRSAMLGSASISAISDTAFIAVTAKINGLSATRAMGKYFQSLSGGSEAKEIARRSGYIVESIAGSVLEDARFAGENSMSGWTGWLSGMTNKMSGLGAMTKATQDSIALEGMATLAETLARKTGWADLDPDLKANLKKFELNKRDWDELAKADLVNAGEGKFLITSELRVDSKLDPARAKEVADKIDDWLMYLRQSAANEVRLSTRAITSGALLGDGGPATASRAVMSSLTMFKSFPITVIMTHLLPAMRRAGFGDAKLSNAFLGSAPLNKRKFDHLAVTMIGTTLLGGLAMQLKEIVKGKTTKESNPMDNPKFWMAAMLQGGGLGLMGDFFLGDYSRFGRNPITEAMGPIPGLFEDIYTATKGNFDRAVFEGDEANPGRDLFRVAKRNIPLGSLWYGRLALERLILDNFERLVDPQFDRRMRKLERKLTKESGQKFWWSPGQGLEGIDPSLIAGEE